MTKKIISISKCEDCPHFRYIDESVEDWGRRMCSELGEDLISSEIPEHCPLPSIPIEKEIHAASAKKEAYHLKGLSDYYGEKTPTSFAAMCCGNSFDEGAKFILKKIKEI